MHQLPFSRLTVAETAAVIFSVLFENDMNGNSVWWCSVVGARGFSGADSGVTGELDVLRLRRNLGERGRTGRTRPSPPPSPCRRSWSFGDGLRGRRGERRFGEARGVLSFEDCCPERFVAGGVGTRPAAVQRLDDTPAMMSPFSDVTSQITTEHGKKHTS